MNEKAKKKVYDSGQKAVDVSHIRMDNVNESLTFSIENIQVIYMFNMQLFVYHINYQRFFTI